MSGCPELPLFKFKMSVEAAESNFHILQRFKFDLGRALEAQAKFTMGYGSEFGKGEVLLPLLQHHPLRTQMMNMLAHGLQCPTQPITKEDRAAELIKALNFGIHRGATTQPKLLIKLLLGDVKYVYVTPHMVFRNGQFPYGKFLCSQMVIPIWLPGSPYGNIFYMGIFTRLPIWSQTLFRNGLVTNLSLYRNGYPLWCDNPRINTGIGLFLIPIW